jgi:hypothetical protein
MISQLLLDLLIMATPLIAAGIWIVYDTFK